MSLDKIVVVTQKTRLEGLLDRFNTRGQAKFWIEHMGTDFADYDREHDTYRRAVDAVCRLAESLERKVQRVERLFLPTLLFAPRDLVVTVGRDGLVVNAAKYVDARPIVAVNPDPARWDGVLLPFTPATARRGLVAALEEKALERPGLRRARALPEPLLRRLHRRRDHRRRRLARGGVADARGRRHLLRRCRRRRPRLRLGLRGDGGGRHATGSPGPRPASGAPSLRAAEEERVTVLLER
jgi:hypothetical protein